MYHHHSTLVVYARGGYYLQHLASTWAATPENKWKGLTKFVYQGNKLFVGSMLVVPQ